MHANFEDGCWFCKKCRQVRPASATTSCGGWVLTGENDAMGRPLRRPCEGSQLKSWEGGLIRPSRIPPRVPHEVLDPNYRGRHPRGSRAVMEKAHIPLTADEERGIITEGQQQIVALVMESRERVREAHKGKRARRAARRAAATLQDRWRWPCGGCWARVQDDPPQWADTMTSGQDDQCHVCGTWKPDYLDPKLRDLRWVCRRCYPEFCSLSDWEVRAYTG